MNSTMSAALSRRSDAVASLATILPFVGRVLISAIFLLSGVLKVAAPAMTIGYIQSAGLPFPPGAFVVAAFIELVGSTILILGYRTRIVAAVFAVYCIATALSFHHNWADQDQLMNFFKNVAMTGGLLQIVAFGGGRLSLDARRRA